MTLFLPRRGFIAATLALGVAIGVPSTVAAATDGKLEDWFRVGETVLDDWQVIAEPTDPYFARVVRTGRQLGQASKKIMIVYPRPSSAYDVAMTQILSVFAAKGIDADFSVYNFRKDDGRGRSAITVAEAEGYDLIMSMGSESTAWLYKNYYGGRLPVISVCSKDPVLLGQTESYDKGTGSNFAFTSLNMPVEVQFSYIAQALPSLKNMAIMVDGRNVSAVETQAKPMADYARQRGMQVIDIVVEDPKNAASELSSRVPEAISLMRKSDPALEQSLFWVTGSTSVFREIETINAHADRAPVLSVVPEVVNGSSDSAVMSIGISFQSNAHLAALYAGEVLSGRRDVGQLPVGIVSPPDIAINFRKAREIGLRVPFNFFESATYIYGYDGKRVRDSRVAGIGVAVD